MVASSVASARVYDGIVKTRTDKYGFIDSAELQDQFSRDVFFFPSMVGGPEIFAQMEPGTAVRFSVQVENEQPRACNVSFPGRQTPRGMPAAAAGPPRGYAMSAPPPP